MKCAARSRPESRALSLGQLKVFCLHLPGWTYNAGLCDDCKNVWASAHWTEARPADRVPTNRIWCTLISISTPNSLSHTTCSQARSGLRKPVLLFFASNSLGFALARTQKHAQITLIRTQLLFPLFLLSLSTYLKHARMSDAQLPPTLTALSKAQSDHEKHPKAFSVTASTVTKVGSMHVLIMKRFEGFLFDVVSNTPCTAHFISWANHCPAAFPRATLQPFLLWSSVSGFRSTAGSCSVATLFRFPYSKHRSIP
jgi:hypothetical protein